LPTHSLIAANLSKGDIFRDGSGSMNLIKKLPYPIMQIIKILIYGLNYKKRSCKGVDFSVSKVANY
jgi:hypothetical protein